MKTSLKSLFVLTTLISGCASSTIPYAFKPIGFTDDEIMQLQAAADEWQTKTGGKHMVIIDPNCSPDVCSTVELVDEIVIDKTLMGVTYGSLSMKDAYGQCTSKKDKDGVTYTQYDCGKDVDDSVTQFKIEIKDLRNDDNTGIVQWFNSYTNPGWNTKLRETFLHELGHAFGKEHNPNKENVMYAYTDGQVPHLTAEDLAN